MNIGRRGISENHRGNSAPTHHEIYRRRRQRAGAHAIKNKISVLKIFMAAKRRDNKSEKADIAIDVARRGNIAGENINMAQSAAAKMNHRKILSRSIAIKRQKRQMTTKSVARKRLLDALSMAQRRAWRKYH